MKKTLKSYLIGFLSAAILAGGVSYATETVRIIIDNKELIPTDVNGNRVDPIIVNGTTYLPVRAIADALGKAVYWDGPNYTVYLGDMNGNLEYPTAYLHDLASISDEVSSRYGSLTDNYGNRYDNYADDGYNGDCKLEYLLNMKYSRLKGTLYVPQGETRDGSGYIQVIADGKTIYTSPDLTKTSRPINVDVNIKGYNNVIVQYTVKDLVLCFGNAGFYQ